MWEKSFVTVMANIEPGLIKMKWVQRDSIRLFRASVVAKAEFHLIRLFQNSRVACAAICGHGIFLLPFISIHLQPNGV